LPVIPLGIYSTVHKLNNAMTKRYYLWIAYTSTFFQQRQLQFIYLFYFIFSKIV